MIWIQRDILKQYTIHPAIIRGSMVTFLGCLMLVSGKLTNTQSLQHFALIVTLLGIIWLLLGTNYLKILVFPIGYLVFMFPLFGMILGKYSLFFQTTSASIAAIILNFFGMPVFRNGCILNLPHITLEVVKVCSGVHHIIALVSVAVPLAWITQKTHLRKLILIVLSFLIGLSANGFRIALIGFWTYFQNDMAIHGPASTLLISVFVFGPGLIVLIAVAVLLNKIPLRIISTNSSSITKNNNVTKDLKQQLNYRPTLIICCLFLITAIFMYLYNPKPVYLSKNLDEIPKEIGLWKGVNVKLLNEPFESYDPAISLKRVYEDGSGNKLKLYIGYFPIQSKNKEIFNSHYDILFENKKNKEILLETAGKAVKINKALYKSGTDVNIAYFFYLLDHKIVTNKFLAKFINLTNIFIKQKNNATIVVISKSNDMGDNAYSFSYQEKEFIENIIYYFMQSVTKMEHANRRSRQG